ncbi:hypothetical protein BJ912DRAFT_1071771 [Pholiota molesta]|nr:hypothetical protein BJ912DRAFT_1071771 [Pholiota molesta]
MRESARGSQEGQQMPTVTQNTNAEVDLQLPSSIQSEPSPPQSLPELPDAPIAPNLSAAGRVVRKKRLTWKLLQQLPAAPTPLPEPVMVAATDTTNSNTAPPPSILETIWEADVMASNTPTSINKAQSPVSSRLSLDPTSDPSYFPFQNSTVFGLMNWMWTGSALKSITEMKKLLNFLKSDDFKKEDLEGFDIRAETAKLDQFLEGSSNSKTKPGPQPSASFPRDGWHESDIHIQVPDLSPHKPDDIPTFTIPGLLHRSLVEVIKSTFSDVASRSFHYTPFKTFWCPNPEHSENLETQRVYDELYSSDAMIKAHMELQQQPREPDCELERVVAGMMFWSDSTHLASFGTASLWPIYLYFGNQSKWVRGKPTAAACHHIAYIPKLPADFFDYYVNLTGDGPAEDVLTHCRRELMHAVWTLLLDDEFMHAYEHGIVIECPDGIFRRFYPRIFTYSADYPEKVLLATIRNLGSCPCPRCLIPKAKIPNVGKVYDDNQRVTTQRIDDSNRVWNVSHAPNGSTSKAALPSILVPTVNAFSSLSKFGFNFFDMLVPDFMHEFELGVWKALFVHLIRIIVAEGAVQELNQRYRQVPTFGRSTIRKFVENASAMKKMAARNYEDLLQCAMPVFDGLLDEPEHDRDIASLLFTVAEWHALAKLRMHTDSTLGWLQQCTASLGRQLRRFQKHTCSFFDTRCDFTPSHYSKKKVFSLSLIKLHALGDYVRTIMMFGTSDSYSTQSGELEHRRVKRFYARTNKNRAVRQITRLERREHMLAGLKREKANRTTNRSKTSPTLDFAQSEVLPHTPPEFHHHISMSRNFPVHIQNFLAATSNEDPAIKDFYPKLQEHLLGRILHPTWSGDGNEFSEVERNRIFIVNERLYRHKVMRINYTTYDVRLGQDSINARNHADIMTLSRNDEDHPFEYGRIKGGPVGEMVQRDTSYQAGFEKKRLHRLQFLPSHDPAAFGFLDPDEVIRAAHLIPAFRYGPTEELLRGESLGRAPGELDDWEYFYVNM